MKRFLIILASMLLLFNGVGALFGGWNLISHPDGSGMKLPIELLKHTPFYDYFIPGMILFVANGLFSIIVLTALLFKFRNYYWFIMIQGAILTGWIIIQIILIQTIGILHAIYGSIGILLIIIGWLQKKEHLLNSKKTLTNE